ncbi:MAG: Alpha-1,3-galactosidase B [Phycisphaerae bacterium]|nr:Alpha-1,3-galactosidase B [Phycisphaerae bacterium]
MWLRSMAAAWVLLIPACLWAGDVRVRDFGAIPDDGKDDAAAIARAADKLKADGGGQLVLEKGRYDFSPPASKMGIVFNGAAGVTVDGNGATLMFSGLMNGLGFGKCRDVEVRNLTIDWARPPFSVGKVVATGEGTFDVQVEEAFPVSGGEPVGAWMEYDAKTRHPLRQGAEGYDDVASTELLGPQKLRVKLKGGRVRARVGSLVVLRHQVYGYNAINFHECTGVAVRDVTILTAPGMGVIGHQSADIAIERLSVVPRGERIMSTTADATHFNACRGKITMTDCRFAGMGDDATNVHGMWHRIVGVEPDGTVLTKCRNDWLMPPSPGDLMELTDPATILPAATVKVEAVTVDPAAKVHRLKLAGGPPKALKEGWFLGDTDWAPKLVIRGCRVESNRARGFLIQTRDALVEGNTFRGCTGAGIHVCTDVGHWTESIGTRDVTIRNNTFEECCGATASMNATIEVFAHLPSWKYAPLPGVHRGVRIEGNVIRDSDNGGIFIACADGAVVAGNTIQRCSRRPRNNSARAAIHLLNSRNVKIEGNTFDGPITIGPGCDPATLQIQDGSGP